MNPQIIKISLYLAEGAAYIMPFFSLFFCFRSYVPAYMRSLPIFLFGNALTEAIMLISQPALRVTEDCYTVFEITYFTYFLSQLIMSRWVKKVTWGLVTIFVLSIIYGYCINNHLYVSFWAPIIESCILIFPCLTYFKEILTQRKDLDLLRDPSFWMVIGIIYYFFLLIPTYLFSMYFELHKMMDISQAIYTTNSYAGLISFSLYIYAMQCSRRPSFS